MTDDLVDKLARAARRAEPPPANLDRMVVRALGTVSDEPIEPVPIKPWFWPAAAGLFAIALAIVWFARPAPVDHPSVETVHLTGGHLEMTVTHPIEVVTDHMTVTATNGTFVVDEQNGVSIVKVHSGSVTVKEAGVAHPVFAGSAWVSTPVQTAVAYVPVAPKPVATPKPVAPAPKPVQVTQPRHYDVPADRTSAWSDDVKGDPLATARGQIKSGRYADALVTLDAIQPKTSTVDQLTGDAHRALGHYAEAAAAYERVGNLESGYTAAYIRHHDLHDDAHAMTSLGVADAQGSPLEERALALRVQILVGLHRDATVHARRYLERFPNGDLHAYMASIIGTAR
ncbi:MAG: hypothetical protein QM831_32605 [Kofleriaceae bacterium]